MYLEIAQEVVMRWCVDSQVLIMWSTLMCVVFTQKIQPEAQSRLKKYNTGVELLVSIYHLKKSIFFFKLLLENID